MTAKWTSVMVTGWTLLFAAVVPCAGDGIRTVGPVIQMSGGDSWQSNVFYNPDDDVFLVLWQQYGGPHVVQKGRCIDASTGAFAGPEFQLAAWVGLCGAAYNPDLRCWFVVYFNDHDLGGDIYGQKVGINGSIGPPVALVTSDSDQALAAIDYDGVRKRYLVAWTDYRGVAPSIRGRFFDGNGSSIPGMPELQISDYTPFSQTSPRVTYNPVTAEFLVVWIDLRNDVYRTDPNENNNNYTDIYGQRIDAVTGTLIGADIPVAVPPPVAGQPYVGDGWDGPGGIVCNTNPLTAGGMYGTYFLGIQKLTAPGWTTKAVILAAGGSHYGGTFNVSHPLRGGYTGVVYNSFDDTYFVTYLDADYDLAGRQYSPTGEPIRGPAKIIANPEFEENFGGLAVRPTDGLYLQSTTWFENLVTHERPYILVAQRFIRDRVPPGPVTGAAAMPGLNRVKLLWTNPVDADFVGTRIVYSTTGYPDGPNSGVTLVDQPGTPGTTSTCAHAGAVRGTTYYYSLFAHDDLGNYATAVHVSGIPGLPGDLDGDGDVDQSDFGRFQACLAGSGGGYGPDCEDADLEADGDVDQGDFAVFQGCVGGSNSPPKC
jgi:hypothetical protein